VLPSDSSSEAVPSVTTSRGSESADAIGDADVLTIAGRAAAAHGDSTPESIRWVFGPRSQLAEAVGFASSPDTADEQQALIVLVGNFVAPTSRGPRGPVRHSGTVISLIVDPADLEVTDYGIGSEHIDLSDIGDVRGG
jgi:hypothetical protein